MLAAAYAQSLQDSSGVAGLRMQLSDAVANAQSQEQLLQQWQGWGANAESLQTQTSFTVTTLEEQLASAQQVCADQQAQVSTLESQLADANKGHSSCATACWRSADLCRPSKAGAAA